MSAGSSLPPTVEVSVPDAGWVVSMVVVVSALVLKEVALVEVVVGLGVVIVVVAVDAVAVVEGLADVVIVVFVAADGAVVDNGLVEQSVTFSLE